jgi:hypothetical protein
MSLNIRFFPSDFDDGTVPDFDDGNDGGGIGSAARSGGRRARPDGHPRGKLEKDQTAVCKLYEEGEEGRRAEAEREHLEEFGRRGLTPKDPDESTVCAFELFRPSTAETTDCTFFLIRTRTVKTRTEA